MMNASPHFSIFAGSTGGAFARRMCASMGVALGKSETIRFSEGNTLVRVGETVRDRDVFLVQSIGADPNEELVEILFWMDAFKRASALSVTLVMPFFSYAKGDKKDEPRVSIRARVCAECIELAGADRVMTMDLHAPQVQGFFKCPMDHLYARPLLAETVKSIGVDNLVIVSPDAGFAKSARMFGAYLNAPVAIGDKTRVDHTENAKVLDIIGDVGGKNALIVDDFTISAGTLVDLAHELKRRGTKRIFACLSHNIATAEAARRITESDIELVITTDTVDNPNTRHNPKFKTVSVAPIFAEAIECFYNYTPISPLFTSVPAHLFDKSVSLMKLE